MKFTTVVERGGATATGLPVPDEVVESLGGGRRPAVRVTVGGHTYRSTVGSRGGRFLVPLSAENRAAAGVSAGDEVEVELALDDDAREIDPPDDLAAALQRAGARAFFDSLAPSHRKEWVRWVEEAKRAETREARIAHATAALAAGKRSR